MRRTLALWLLPLFVMLAASVLRAATPQPVIVIGVTGVIGPATSDFVHRSLQQARERNAQLVVLKMDTPGGLDDSMRRIIQNILASPIPVATLVAPEGARAASAGTYILYASHIAAMTPATNVGAATPVAISGGAAPGPRPDRKADDNDRDVVKGNAEGKVDGKAAPRERRAAPSSADAMREKAVNDATAYLLGLAELRGRNTEFAEQAVRAAASLSAREALKRGVIDYVAADVPDLVRQLEGRRITLQAGTVTLTLKDAPIETIEPDLRTRVLSVLTNPMLAMVLMMIGVYGLFIEFTSPGFGVPGVAGAIALLLALYSFQLLPVNWAGVALLGLGAALMIAEVFVPSFGALGVGGIIAFVVGGMLLMDGELPALQPSWPEVTGLAVISAAAIVAFGVLARRAHRRPVVSGQEDMVGAVGVVTTADGPWAEVRGERWKVRGAEPLAVGDRVRITRVDGLTLDVIKDSNSRG